ncbi:hypothetical protein CcrC1_gp193 [Caulobacter phage C1]|nr:hypothetical protein CcrC1_gp193 [Caulobacter phage C1]UTU08422.1 hypothetical protein CcrC2_gp194 [Caulobacter phage C2]UTU08939.1 hypothetical protein CcrJ4_gp188 [Caulobacter phage J4]UTU09495.1 hypothetical protein CcrBL47_gp209 [Caulobacter phage BL47]UTU10055.1 hypothetical protein CcrRB23_gp193 [Caulobacter phage RB23]WGN97090.1 hypothetical protein [Bertelyvirus sp.]
MSRLLLALLPILAYLGTLCVIVAAWVTHIVICLKTANLVFLIAGALIFPIAVIHGVGSWFGAW